MAALAAVILVGGCDEITGGTARPAPGAARPALKQVLLDGAALTKLLGQPFKSVPFSPPSYGGSEKFGTAYASATPAECIGVVFMMQKIVYQSVPVQNVADELWTSDDHSSVKVDSVDEGVMSFPSPKDAAAAFAKFSAQWQGCDGTTLNVSSVTSASNVISDVRIADSVVAASVVMHPPEHSILTSVPVARALGVRGNYLVEVAVDFFGDGDPSAQGSADIKTSAVDIVHAMLALS